MFLQRQRTFSVLVATLAFGCSSPTAPLSVDATVRLASTVEGGCWSLVTATNTIYQPVDLPSSFRIDGLAVHAVLRDAPGWATICYVGPLVHVDRIRTR